MERFNWTTDQVDQMDFFQTTEILFNEEAEKDKKEPLMFIDQIGI